MFLINSKFEAVSLWIVVQQCPEYHVFPPLTPRWWMYFWFHYSTEFPFHRPTVSCLPFFVPQFLQFFSAIGMCGSLPFNILYPQNVMSLSLLIWAWIFLICCTWVVFFFSQLSINFDFKGDPFRYAV